MLTLIIPTEPGATTQTQSNIELADIEIPSGSQPKAGPSRTITSECASSTGTEQFASTASDITELADIEMPSASQSTTEPKESVTGENFPEFDLGNWIGKNAELSTVQKSQILKRCWVPSEGYNFHDDTDDEKRCFKHDWLKTYAPWLAYSKKLKGALCLYCVLFPPTVVKGVMGAFMVKPFTKYRDLHDSCRNHATSQWHRVSMQSAKDFTESIPVDVMMISGHQKQLEKNRQILMSILNTVIFCGSHDIALRGKKNHEGKFFTSLLMHVSTISVYFSIIHFICRKF